MSLRGKPPGSNAAKAGAQDESLAASRLSILMAKAGRPSSADAQAAAAQPSVAVNTSNAMTGSMRITSPSAASPSIALPEMAGDKAGGLQSDAVWRSSAARRAEKAWAAQSERALANDAKFKKFQVAVEKALSTFDSVSEWADFISFLSRLQKTLQGYPNFNSIPRKLIVAKRLSQCLNPALPSGVHQKALDVYEQILRAIGKEGLRRDLHVWSPGLFPFFQFASTSVKPHLLDIFDRFYLPLHDDLRPVGKALCLALLPGLEEEAGEFFDRVLKLMDHVSEALTQSFFLQSIWLIMITATAARLAALNYLVKRMPRLNRLTGSEAGKVVGNDLGLMVRAFVLALKDDALLVKRLALDLLVTHLPVSCDTFAKVIKPNDATLLVDAAISVVLRRDLSLNRRLYSWLLGPEEEDQNAYLIAHSLDLVRLALIQRLDQTVAGQEEGAVNDAQEPYRVFISLLDKWEIGQPLSNVIILDIFSSLQKATNRGQINQTDAMGTTEKMIFEVVDPFATYRQFFFALKHELDLETNAANQRATLTSSRTVEVEQDSAVALLSFVLRYFPVHDEEVRRVHLPAILGSLIHLVHRLATRETASTSRELVPALGLARNILALIPAAVFARVPEDNPPADEVTSPAAQGRFVEQVEQFYSPRTLSAEESAKLYLNFRRKDVTSALTRLCGDLAQEALRREYLGYAVVESGLLLRQLFAKLDESESKAASGSEGLPAGPLVKIAFSASSWKNMALSVLERTEDADRVEVICDCVLAAVECPSLAESPTLSSRAEVHLVVSKLLSLLSRPSARKRIVDLLIKANRLAPSRLVEAALCAELTQTDFPTRLHAFNHFGVLWKAVDDREDAQMFLDLPLRIVLDGLQSQRVSDRQAAEVWLRNHVRSFVGVTTPLLRQMLEVPVTLRPSSEELFGIATQGFIYEQPFDSDTLSYAMRALVSVIKEGGLSCLKTLRSTPIGDCRDPALGILCQEAGFSVDQSVLDLGLDMAVRLLRANCPERYEVTMGKAVENLQAEAAELVQHAASRQQIGADRVAKLQQILIQRIAKAIAQSDLLVQNKLLRTLHALLSCEESAPSDATITNLNLLLRAGLSERLNRPTMHQWADFVFSILPVKRTATPGLLVPLASCICDLLLADLSAQNIAGSRVVSPDFKDTEFTTLINLVERVLNICLGEVGQHDAQTSDSNPSRIKSADDLDGATSFMTYVTGGRAAGRATTESSLQPQQDSVRSVLDRLVLVLKGAWGSIDQQENGHSSGSAVGAKIKARCRRAIERLYRLAPVDVMIALIGTEEPKASAKSAFSDALFEIISILVPSEQIVVTYMCDVLSNRLSPSDKGKNRQIYPHISEEQLFRFMEAYLERLNGETSAQVWPVLHMLTRDLVASSSSPPPVLYSILRCLTTIVSKISQSKTFEDRRLRKEIQDHYTRLFDQCVLIAGRVPEASLFGRRTAREPEAVHPEARGEESMAASLSDLHESALAQQIIKFFSSKALAVLRQMTLDADRLNGLCTNILYYVVGPALRTKSANFDVEGNTLELLQHICTLPGTTKVWRTQVGDAFNDPRFFKSPMENALKWRSIVLNYFSQDKERMADLIARIGTSPSANIFTNRDAEARQRAMHVRRLSFILSASEVDFWLPQFPSIQERLVEILKATGIPDVVQAEVWLCLRVILLRFSTQHLSPLWPVIIAEMMRIYDELTADLPKDGSQRLHVVVEVSKFLDLLLTLQSSDFQVHQWLFVNDTTDVVYPPDDYTSEAIIDLVSQKLVDLRPSESSKQRLQADFVRRVDLGEEMSTRLRKPVIMSGPIDAIEELAPFFRHISISTYEAVYSTAGVDTDYLQSWILEDILEGSSL